MRCCCFYSPAAVFAFEIAKFLRVRDEFIFSSFFRLRILFLLLSRPDLHTSEDEKKKIEMSRHCGVDVRLPENIMSLIKKKKNQMNTVDNNHPVQSVTGTMFASQ